jgi:hypothetical protein
MIMIKKFLFAALPALAMVGCLNEASEDPRAKGAATNAPESSLDLSTLETPVKFAVGSKSVTLYKSPDGLEVIETVQPKGELPLLTPEMNGKTWKEIVESIAPGSELAPAYANEIYQGQTGVSVPAEMSSQDGLIAQPEKEGGALAKTSADASWFQQNYCSSGNAFSWCLLNRAGAWTDWGQTNCKMSFAYIIMNSGTQVNFTIKVDGKKTLTTTILNDNYVHGYTTTSSKDFFGLINVDLHRYDVGSTNAANSWHWAVRGSTW